MEYNSSYKSAVLGSLRSAASGLNSCKSVNITIPGDFEGAGILRSALNTLKSVNISGIISEVNSAAAGFEAAERAVEGGMLDFSSLFGSFIGSNISSKAHNYNLKKAQKSGTMYELDHLTEEQKEKINQGVKEASKDNWVFRTRASIVNGLVSIFKGGYKMGENIGDFIALRAEKLQEDHLRTIYTSNAEYEKANKEKYEKNIEKMRKETMSYVAKDHTEATFNRLYRDNNVLKEIDERAYNAFKTTGGAYKIGEQVAPAIVATGAMVVAPEAAPTIVPIVIGMNSGGRASEEYLQDKKMNSKEGVEQAYKDGEIDKKTYESYKYIWGLTSEEVIDVYLHGEKYGLTPLEVNKFMEIYHISQDMSDEYTTKENMENAIKYGNAVGAWDAAQYAIGMNLFKVNPTGSTLGNSSIRVGIDTSLNAADTPFKAVVRSSIDKDTNFETEFNKLGGWNSVKTSAALGFAGSVFGEVMQYKAAKNKANDTVKKIYEMQGVSEDELDLEFKKSLNDDIMRGKINLEDVKNDKSFLVNYAEKHNFDTRKLPVDVKIKEAQIRSDNFMKNHGIKWMTKGKKITDNIIVTKTQEEFENILINQHDYTPEEIKGITGLHTSSGEILLPPDFSIKTVIHEYNHSLGYIDILDESVILEVDLDGTGAISIWRQRGIDEAVTESIALKKNLEYGVGKTDYDVNVKALNQMVDLMNENGYEDVLLYSYFGKDKTLFAKTVNKIVEDNTFYDRLVGEMNAADGVEELYKFWGDNYAEVAQAEVKKMVNYFEDCITRKKGGK